MERIIDMINKDIQKLGDEWANSNAHGFPVTDEGTLTLERLDDLKFKEKINILHPYFPEILKDIADLFSRLV